MLSEILFYGILLLASGELPKRLKGAVSKTARRESVRGFKSLILRHTDQKSRSVCFSFRFLPFLDTPTTAWYAEHSTQKQVSYESRSDRKQNQSVYKK